MRIVWIILQNRPGGLVPVDGGGASGRRHAVCWHDPYVATLAKHKFGQVVQHVVDQVFRSLAVHGHVVSVYDAPRDNAVFFKQQHADLAVKRVFGYLVDLVNAQPGTPCATPIAETLNQSGRLSVYLLMANRKKRWTSTKLWISLACVFVGGTLSRVAWSYLHEPLGAVLIIAGAAFVIASLILFAIYFTEY